jgi:two-component system response regulator HupR/HoxA
VPVDVRVIAATHRDLEADMRAGRFREDLYYRIATFTLAMPPLRERPGDVVPIAQALLADVCRDLGLPAAHFDDDARAVLMGYPWPGNIRELRNEIARAVALTDGPGVGPHLVHAHALSPKLLQGQTGRSAAANGTALPASGTLQERLDAIEAMLLREVMLRQRWNKTRAAEELGLSRVGLRAKLVRFGIEVRNP